NQTMTSLLEQACFDISFKRTRLKLQFSTIVIRSIHAYRVTNVIILITRRIEVFQGLPNQIILKLQLLVILQMNDLTTATRIINRTRCQSKEHTPEIQSRFDIV